MKIHAVADLGGLGAREGPGVSYLWTLPSVWLYLLQWLPLLTLLLLVKRNRSARAWWILGPVIAVLAFVSVAGSLDLLPSGVEEIFGEAIAALAFGLAAVWLLAPLLTRSHRFLTFLCFVPAFALASGLTILLRQNWGEDAPFMALQVIIFAAFGLGVISLALLLAGCLCRRRYSPVRFTIWCLALLAALWFVVTTPFVVIAAVASSNEAPWGEFLGAIVVIVGLSFGLVLPFLLLSFANGLYRERLKQLFPMADPLQPAVAAPSPPLATEVSGSL